MGQKLRVFTSFSGYDSQCLALNRLKQHHPKFNYDLVGWSEIDRYAIRVHNVLFPQYADRNYGNICDIDWAKVPDFDLFTMSSPCQDFSAAGRRMGGDEGTGTRSSLLWECKKAIIAKKPKYIIFENVKALMYKRFMPGFLKWQQWLEEQGYTNTWQVMNARDYDVPQMRQRVFMVSIRNAEQPFEFPAPVQPTRSLISLIRDKDEVEPRYFLGKRREEILIQYTERKFYKNSSSQEELDCFRTLSKLPKFKEDTVVLSNPRGVWGEIRMHVRHCPTMLSSCGPGGIMVLHHDTHQLRYLSPREWFRLMDVDEADIDKIEAMRLSPTQRVKLAGNSIVVGCLYHIMKKLFTA